MRSDIFTYGLDSNSWVTWIVTSFSANGDANNSPDMNWELTSPSIQVSPPFNGPCTYNSDSCKIRFETVDAPSSPRDFSKGVCGRPARFREALSLIPEVEVAPSAARSRKVVPDSPQSMLASDCADMFSTPLMTRVSFSVRTFAPRV